MRGDSNRLPIPAHPVKVNMDMDNKMKTTKYCLNRNIIITKCGSLAIYEVIDKSFPYLETKPSKLIKTEAIPLIHKKERGP